MKYRRCAMVTVVVAVGIWALRLGFGSRGDGEHVVLSNDSSQPNNMVGSTDPSSLLPTPPRYATYYDLCQQDKLDLVTQHMHDKALSGPELAFLRQELANRELLAVTRNNIANALIWQREPDPLLHRVFIGFIHDAQESQTWREYSVQFLASTLPFTGEPELVRRALLDLVEQDRDGLAGTAAIMLALHSDYGHVDLPSTFDRHLGRVLDDPRSAKRLRMAALGVIGKRGLQRHVETVRLYAAQHEDDGLKRVALATLGQLGDEAARPLLEAHRAHPNRAVALAAQGAVARLDVQAGVTDRP